MALMRSVTALTRQHMRSRANRGQAKGCAL